VFKISEIILEKENLRVRVEEKSNLMREVIGIKDGNKWLPILSNLEGYSTLTFWLRKELYFSQESRNTLTWFSNHY